MINLSKVKRPSLLTDKHAASADQLRSDYQCSKISSEELLVEIFTRMPVKSVCCIRCVSKSWNNLISSSFFISHYHQNSSIPPTLKSCILFMREVNGSNLYAFYHPDNGVAFDQRTMFKSLPFEHLPFRTCDKHDHLTFLDAIHGVVCLTFSKKPSILWNPTIRKYVKIPKSPFKFRRITSYAPSLGFGFNSLKYDFNLIRLWMPFHLESHAKCCALLVYEVFSAREGAWKKAVGSEIQPGKVISETSFFMNGRIHWIVSVYKFGNQMQVRGIKCYRLLMFDCERQEFTTMKLPRKFKDLEENNYNVIFLFKWRDMLSVMAVIRGSLYVWVMEEYGKGSSWRSLHYRDEFFNLVLEESISLMDAKGQVFSYGEKHDRNDGKVYYETDDVRTCEHILI